MKARASSGESVLPFRASSPGPVVQKQETGTLGQVLDLDVWKWFKNSPLIGTVT